MTCFTCIHFRYFQCNLMSKVILRYPPLTGIIFSSYKDTHNYTVTTMYNRYFWYTVFLCTCKHWLLFLSPMGWSVLVSLYWWCKQCCRHTLNSSWTGLQTLNQKGPWIKRPLRTSNATITTQITFALYLIQPAAHIHSSWFTPWLIFCRYSAHV